MDQLGNGVNIAANAAGTIADATNLFDLEKENFGIFTNMTLLSMLLLSLTKDRTPVKSKHTFKGAYDYVIVGGGTAGSVLANRLAEEPCINVLLLEAGGEPPILTEVPGLARLFHNSPIDWSYRTTPQKYAGFGLRENRVPLANGRVLGGSSTMNAMMYIRGNLRNYDQWEAEGATGWSYDDVLPYFLKLEDNRNIELLDPGYHQVGGPMTAEKINYIPEIKNPILEAATALGYETLDVNGRRQTGVFDIQATVRNQQRCSTAKAYLNPARNKPNLDVLTNAYARKILISKRGKVKRAYGIEFDHGGRTHKVQARKEVILSNGAIRTPQLLMLSGIGPKEHLKKFNVSIVADLPGVGKNFHDHVSSHVVYTVSESIMPIAQKILNPLNILDYAANRRGPLCTASEVTLVAFLDGLNTTENSRDFPKQEFHFAEYDALDAAVNYNFRKEVYERVYQPYVGKPLYICYVSVIQPYSRGEITLNSTDPYDMPNINPNYFKDERDLKNAVEGMKICNAIAKQPSMQKIRVEPLKTIYPGCEEFVGDEENYLTCVAKLIVQTYWHYCGTARMGQREDPRSVVDPKLRVIGVKNLRVVNAAIFPIIPSGNTNIPTMMVAEKASDMIKENIKCKGTQQVLRRNYHHPLHHY